AEDGIRDFHVTGVQTCALPIYNVIQFYIILVPGTLGQNGRLCNEVEHGIGYGTVARCMQHLINQLGQIRRVVARQLAFRKHKHLSDEWRRRPPQEALRSRGLVDRSDDGGALGSREKCKPGGYRWLAELKKGRRDFCS